VSWSAGACFRGDAMNSVDPLSAVLPPQADQVLASSRTAVGDAAPEASSSSGTAISDLGRALSQASSRTSSSASSRYQDIEDSDLPDSVKNLLRMIRELREK